MANESYLTPQNAQEFAGGRWLNCDMNIRFTGVSYAQFIKGNLYFPLNKDKRNLESIQKYISSGIGAVVLDNEDLISKITVPILLVADIGKAFEKIARGVRSGANPQTVLITGTEGKTGTKLQLHHVLEKQTKVHAILNSQNNLNSVYRTLADIGVNDRVEIAEVGCGANTNLNRTRGRAVNPDICFYTQIGLAHMDFHKDLDGLLQNKASVLAGLRDGGLCIVNSTIDCYGKFIDKIRAEKNNVTLLTYGENDSDTAKVIERKFDGKRRCWNIKADIEGEIVEYFHPVFHQFIPVMSVGILLLVKRLGFDIQRASLDFGSFTPYETMGQLLEIRKGDDQFLFYNQSRRGGGINSLVSSFQDLGNFECSGKIIALLGSMSVKEDKKHTFDLHKSTADLVNSSKIERLYTTGVYMDIIRDNLDDSSIFVKHSDDYPFLLNELLNELEDGDLLFIKGHASLNLARLAKMILNHEDTLHSYKIVKGLISL